MASAEEASPSTTKISVPFLNPLPGAQLKWSASPLGTANNWSPCLKTYVRAIATLPHPAAIFWGDNLVLLYNEAWASTTRDLSDQGRPQRGALPAGSEKALQAAFHGGRPSKAAAHELLKLPESDSKSYTVLLSPLLDPDSGTARGVMAQLIPEPGADKPSPDIHAIERLPPNSRSDSAIQNSAMDCSANDQVPDNVPLDEHPFFHRFAEMLPTGLAILNHEAEAVFVNQYFYELTTHMGDDRSFKSWPQSIHPDDYDRVISAYHEAFKKQQQLRMEFRAQGQQSPWRLLLLTPLGDDNLRHVSLREHGGFICSIVDITSEKSAELTQRKAAKEARERKEQQERFIDMISHEIRNPLSAVLHCAEDISEAVRVKDKDKISVSDIIEAAETIVLCVTHQKNIVDDVLSFSKLDASMLSLSPRSVQPVNQLAKLLKMFQPELRKQDMQFEYDVDYSYDDLKVGYVKADLVRIGQVLINLVSNAIKFTAKKNGEKKISVCVGASLTRPTSYPPNIVFFDPEDHGYRMDATITSEWGNGEAIYLMVAVKDTGIGISDEGQKRLFERFRQATPKTEEIYGGSGLGLNISRKLCHLHGGEIGVSSKDGEGSTFGFFFKVRRCEPPSLELSRDDVELEDDKRRDQIRALGNLTPEDDEEASENSLRDPPTSHIKEAAPEGSEDSRSIHTAVLAAEVEKDRQNSKGDSSPSERLSAYKERLSGDAMEAWEKKHGGHKKKPDRKNEAGEGGKERSKSDSAHGSDQEAASMPRPHILLVEDNIINQRILSRKLESRGFRVTTANNGREAVQSAQNSSSSPNRTSLFDCILMDQEMPVMDGNAAATAIRELEKKGLVGHIPILGVTANVRGEQRDQMLRAGMDDVIHKPYKIEDIVGKIKTLVQAQR